MCMMMEETSLACEKILRLLLNQYRKGIITKEILLENSEIKINYLIKDKQDNKKTKELIEEVLKECL